MSGADDPGRRSREPRGDGMAVDGVAVDRGATDAERIDGGTSDGGRVDRGTPDAEGVDHGSAGAGEARPDGGTTRSASVGRPDAPPLRGVVVVATDTDVGKTVLAAAICARLRADGTAVVAHKPAVTGLDDPAPEGGRDHELLAACTGQRPEDVTPRRYGPAVSPHLAAELAGERLVPAELVATAARLGVGRTLVVEGIGGLLVPFDRAGYDVRALAADLGLPVVVAARPGLGTINHVRLTVDVARAAGLDVRAVVLTPWPAADALADDNRRTVAALTDVPTHVLPQAELTPDGLATAAADLPVETWIGDATAPIPARPDDERA